MTISLQWDFFIYISMEATKLPCYFIVYVVLEFDYSFNAGKRIQTSLLL